MGSAVGRHLVWRGSWYPAGLVVTKPDKSQLCVVTFLTTPGGAEHSLLFLLASLPLSRCSLRILLRPDPVPAAPLLPPGAANLLTPAQRGRQPLQEAAQCRQAHGAVLAGTQRQAEQEPQTVAPDQPSGIINMGRGPLAVDGRPHLQDDRLQGHSLGGSRVPPRATIMAMEEPCQVRPSCLKLLQAQQTGPQGLKGLRCCKGSILRDSFVAHFWFAIGRGLR
mmetsp:Transcript_35930/g.101777  ORF Transcript_35930/g.101777 Transcript_35930/m.101777 type:complete len:222 (+) Transcript_35930:552-1217(+)